MHLTVPSKSLAKDLDFVYRVVKGQKRLLNTVYENAMLIVAGGVLTIQVYDQVLGAAIRLGCRVKESGGIMVPCETLLSQAKSGADVASEITLRSTDKMRLIVEAGKHNSRMLGTDTQAFPTHAFEPMKPLLEGSVEEWRQLLKPGFHCHFKSFQFLIEGTQLVCEGSRVTAKATDIRRISYTSLSLPSANGEQWSAFLPHRFVEQVIHLLGTSKDEDRAVLGATNQLYDFSVNGTRVVTVQVRANVTFPEMGIGKVLRYDPEGKLTVNREDLDLALNAVKPFADRGEGIDPRARLVYAAGELSIQAVSTTRGEFAASVDSAESNNCKPFELNFNPTFLAQYLDAIGKIKQVSIFPIDGFPVIELRPGTGEEKGSRHWIQGQDR